MSLCPRRGLLALLPLLWLSLPATVRASHGIEDGAHLFSRSAWGKAVDAIDEIHHRTGKDLLIQTVNRLSPEETKKFHSTPEAERDQFFRTLAEQAARRWEVNGVYVILCRVPAVEEARPGLFRSLRDIVSGLLPPQVVGRAVVVYPSATEPYFPPKDQDDLNALFSTILVTEHNQDEVLTKAVTLVGDKLELHARELGAPPPDHFHWTSVLWAAAILAGTWGFVGLVRARVAARQGTPGPVPSANEALAAQFGTAGVLWLLQAYQTPCPEAAPPLSAEQPAPPSETEGIPPADGLHPDDREALARGPQPWDNEDAEARTGHDLT